MSSRSQKILNLLNSSIPPKNPDKEQLVQKTLTQDIIEKENIPLCNQPKNYDTVSENIEITSTCDTTLNVPVTDTTLNNATASIRSRSYSSNSSSSSSSNSSSSNSSSTYCNTCSSSSSRSSTPKNRDNFTTLNNADGTPARRAPVVNYHVSPINSAESEADLSDSDPTYNKNQGSRPRLPSTTSLSSATETTPEVTTSKKLSRKRKADPTKWKQNQQKIKRNLGEAYTSTNSKKQVPAREMKPPCAQKCRLKCSEKINNNKRIEYFKSFWALGSLQLQRMFILSSMVPVTPKYKYTNSENPRQPNSAFYFTDNADKIKVCKTFFQNTLGITTKMIRTVREKNKNNGFIGEDQRGKHTNHKTVGEDLRNDIKQFIDSIPRIESHYLRSSTSREYIGGEKSIADLFRDFQELQKKENKQSGKFHTFYELFNTFNISFYQPKKDQCDLCLQYANSTSDQKREIQEKYDTHLEEKRLSRAEKKNDRNNVDECNFCVCFDVQAIMQSPNGETSSFYYKSKLNSYNFTMTELGPLKKDGSDEDYKSYGDVDCYFWDETQGKRGAVEIGSCILDYLKRVTENAGDREINVTFISDNATGQNKNKFLASLYMFAVTNIKNLKTITHKYLIKGHTQNEADNVHSLIQKQITKDLKSGPIYTPIQYIDAIRRARKNGKPFCVHTLTYDFFYDLKDLQEQWGYNFNVDEEKNTVIWNDIRVMKFTKQNAFSFYYKLSYKEEFKEINVRNKRKRMLEATEISIQKAYTAPFELSLSKKKDLQELISKRLIDPYYATYFETMLM